ncbi:MAG: hypothetical protein ACM3MH_10325 [Actinomycetota bacterium]
MRRKAPRREAEKKRQARQRAARDLAETMHRFGLNGRQPSGGIVPDPLAAKPFVRRPKLAPTSNRIPGSAPQRDLLTAHKWRRGAEEKESTIREMQAKRSRIAPAYNKGALQYLPANFNKPDGD